MKQKYTFEKVQEEALKYTSKVDFETNSRPFYAAAHRNKWLDTVCSHMIVIRKMKWFKNEIEEEAKKYKTRSDFEIGSRGAYKAALNMGIIDEVCQHMNKPQPWNKIWTETTLIQEALKFKDKREWRLASPGSYSAAWKLGILKNVASHMKRPSSWNKTWTYESSLRKVKSSYSRIDFQKMNPGAYDFLQSNNLLEKAYDEAGLKTMSGTSTLEQELLSWILSINSNAISHHKLDNNKQLDVYVPELNLGIEFCGVYWHSEEFLKKSYHHDKMVAAQKQGIRLITIFDNEWNDRKDQVKGFLSSVIKKANNVIYARKCKVAEVDKSIARAFLREYHIQGAANSVIYLGLYHKDELVGVMSGGKHHRINDSKELILDRLCFKSDLNIVGGASKLLATLEIYARKNGYLSIKSWSDNRWSEGNVYNKMGFTKSKELKPDYFYSKNGKPYSKQSLKKTENEKLSGKTETELRAEQGYFKVWDCGKIQWTKLL